MSEERIEEKPKRGSNPLRVRSFRLLWIGESISVLGDQFYMIALPWLVLQLTGDAFAVGTVLALAGIPRALFMLVGGAYTDRFSARTIMLLSNLARMVLVGLLTALVLANLIELWMLYVFALAFGLADAFFFPASSAIVPQIVKEEQLQSANAIIQGTAQLSVFAGPVLAGLLIALAGGATESGPEAVPGLVGIGLAFAIDALTFLVSVATLAMMRVEKPKRKRDEQVANVFSSIKEGLAYVWNDLALRSLFILVAGINVLVNGPIIVGIPVLADVRLEGAASFGVVMAAFGGGAFIGTILAGVLRKPSPRWLGSLLLIIISWLGIAMALFGFSTSTMIASVLVLSMGIANGYVVILFITWLQSRIPQDMLGRIMSLLMFASVGLNPVSTALAGALIKVDMTGLFVGAGILMTVITLSFLLIPEVRGLGLETPNGRPIGVETAMRRTGELPALGSVLSTGEVPAVRTTDETGIVE